MFLKTIRARLLFSFGGASLLLILTLSSVIVFFSSNYLTTSTNDLSNSLVQSKSAEMSRWLEGLSNETSSYSNLNIIKRADLDEISTYLIGRHNSINKNFAFVFFAKTDG